jgi:hypothetical protein
MRIDIRSEIREDGKKWFTPYRRIFPFIWTQYFKTNGAISSTDIREIKTFIREVDPEHNTTELLNAWGKVLGIKRKFLESNKSYKKRLKGKL